MSKTQIKKEITDLLSNKGIPARFTANPEKYRALFGKLDQDFYKTADGEVVTKEDQEKYLPEAFIYINVSKQFPDLN
jgi:hypothetical protein